MGSVALRPLPPPRGGVGPLPLEARFRRRLGADDRGDDAAEQHSAGHDVRALVGPPPAPGALVGLLLAGYLACGPGSASGRGSLDRGIHAAVDALPWLAAHPQLILGATLLAAGLWQFSPLRDRCLDECRSPLGFVMNRWRGVSERREAFAMGVAHGAFCVGCCWSLMLVMFGVGPRNVAAMLALGGLTAVEKNLPWGRRLTRPLGVVLVLAAVYAVAA